MFEQAVGHLVEAEAHVLEADLLTDDDERHRGTAAMHVAHDPRQYRGIAHAGVEQP